MVRSAQLDALRHRSRLVDFAAAPAEAAPRPRLPRPLRGRLVKWSGWDVGRSTVHSGRAADVLWPTSAMATDTGVRDGTGLDPGPVGAENPVTSCHLHVFVDEPAEPISPERPDGSAGTR